MATIDERIEALTQSVELISGAQLITERRMGELAQSMNKLSLVMNAIAQAHLEHEGAIDKLNDAVNRLSLIAGNHEDRIDTLEEGEAG